jgi:hypothetical protein
VVSYHSHTEWVVRIRPYPVQCDLAMTFPLALSQL